MCAVNLSFMPLFPYARYPLSISIWSTHLLKATGNMFQHVINYLDRNCQDNVCMKWEYWSTMQKIKHYKRHQNKVNENKVLYCKALRCETIKNNKRKLFSFMLNLQTYYHFKLDFQKVNQHTRDKWLIHGTKCHKGTCSIQWECPGAETSRELCIRRTRTDLLM